MPGRTPNAAARAFLEPLQASLSCIGHAKITTSPGGLSKVGQAHAWTINGGAGIELRDALRFSAAMQYEFYESGLGGDERWRVRTLGYLYTVDAQAGEALSFHWHPRSVVSHPHLHVGRAVLTPDGVITPRAHIPTSRISFESVIRMLITELHVPPAKEDWHEVLELHEGIFKLHRKWGPNPLRPS